MVPFVMLDESTVGSPKRPDNLEIDNDHGHVMERQKLTKSHGIWDSVESNNFTYFSRYFCQIMLISRFSVHND